MFKSSGKRKNAKIDSLVGSNTEILGDVKYSGGLHIDGVVKGNVVADTDDKSMLSVSEQGVVEGDVRVSYIILNGTVIGNVYALERIELAPNARVTGNVYYNLIEMAMGSEVNGNLVHQIDAKVSDTKPGRSSNLVEEVATPVMLD
ncbi:MAG: polymer-forming cytoskeletal protein [Gammaproteobacteria bacterium]|nr:polymer-forming cytoskeletal protein [Gammaproteobacteria bacterium]